MGNYIERQRLADLAADVCSFGAHQSLQEVLDESPDELVPLSQPSLLPLDVHTYRVRRDRWRAGEGPTVHGIEDFVALLEQGTAPKCGVTVSGGRTTYVILLDESAERVVAATAVEQADLSADDV